MQHGLVSPATTQPFLTFLLGFYTPCQEARAALLALPLAGAQLVTLVLLQARGRELSLGSTTSSLPSPGTAPLLPVAYPGGGQEAGG